MPTYQYECSACGHSFEAFQPISQTRLKKCPQCEKDKLDRLIGSGSGIIFKGNGFYETDYKNKRPSCPKAAQDNGGKSGKPESCKSCPHSG